MDALAADMEGMTIDLNGEPNNPPAIIDIPDETVTEPPPPPEPPQGAAQSL
jgi:penicillin-binding protein 1A